MIHILIITVILITILITIIMIIVIIMIIMIMIMITGERHPAPGRRLRAGGLLLPGRAGGRAAEQRDINICV